MQITISDMYFGDGVKLLDVVFDNTPLGYLQGEMFDPTTRSWTVTNVDFSQAHVLEFQFELWDLRYSADTVIDIVIDTLDTP